MSLSRSFAALASPAFHRRGLPLQERGHEAQLNAQLIFELGKASILKLKAAAAVKALHSVEWLLLETPREPRGLHRRAATRRCEQCCVFASQGFLQFAQIRTGEIGVEPDSKARQIANDLRFAQGRQIVCPRFFNECAGEQAIERGARPHLIRRLAGKVQNDQGLADHTPPFPILSRPGAG